MRVFVVFCTGVWRAHGFVYISVVGPRLWCFQAQKSVNMLTSLKLNAVQVIKFTGEYNYRSMGGIYTNRMRNLVIEITTIYLKITQSHIFSTKSRKISVRF